MKKLIQQVSILILLASCAALPEKTINRRLASQGHPQLCGLLAKTFLRKLSIRVKPNKLLVELTPTALRDKNSGEIVVDLKNIKNDLIPGLKERGLKPNEKDIFIWLDGGTKKYTVPLNQDEIRIQSGPANRQIDLYIEVVDDSNKTIHLTGTKLFESLEIPIVSGYHKLPTTQISFPRGFEKNGAISNLFSTAVDIQKQKVSWYLKPGTKNKELARAFEQYGSDLKVAVILDKDQIKPSDVIVEAFDKVKGTVIKIPAKLDDFYFTAGAAFSWNWFDWDSRIVARGIRFFNSDLADRTRQLGRDAQKLFGSKKGDLRRELSYTLRPFHRPHNIKMGKKILNLESFNPPLSGWAAKDVLRWDPHKTTTEFLEDMIDSLSSLRHWLTTEEGIAIKGNDGKLLGFRWTALGSGRDNAYRGDMFVDLMAYYKMMIDQETEFRLLLGDFDKASKLRKEANEIKDLLNTRYWNQKKGMFVDLLYDEASGAVKQDTTLNASNFWPAMGKVADKFQLERMIENLNDPKKFGLKLTPSLSADDPRFNAQGGYWKGGAWPPDFVMIMDWLYVNGFRAEAKKYSMNIMNGMSEGSVAYKLGDTPRNAIDGKTPVDIAQKINDPNIIEKFADKKGTVWESYGLRTDENGNMNRISWNKQESDGKIHETRHDFGGWGISPVTESIRTIFGLEGVPRYVGKKSREKLSQWMFTLLSDELFNHLNVKNIPELAPLKRLINIQGVGASLKDFEHMFTGLVLKKNSFKDQIELISRGYIEFSPTFDPQTDTIIKNLVYDKVRFDLKIENLGDNRVKISVDSKKEIPIQINRHWTLDNQTTDEAIASSNIVKVGGRNKTMEVQLFPN